VPSTVFLKQLTVIQQVEKLPTFIGTEGSFPSPQKPLLSWLNCSKFIFHKYQL